jgi:Tfp pilus assembly PilM family ATPase
MDDRAGYSPIGVEITSTSIAAAQWKRGRHGLTWVAGVRYDRRVGEAKPGAKQEAPDAILSEREARTLAGVLRRQRFVGRSVVIAAPDTRLMIATLELPPKGSGAPLAQIAGAELARMHRKEPGALRTQFWEVAPPTRAGASDATHAMAVGIESADALALSDALESAGLALVAIDARCWALARVACALLQTGEGAQAAVALDVGECGALLTVVRLDPSAPKDQPVCEVVYERLIADLGRGAIRAKLCETAKLDASIVDMLLRPGGLAGESDLSDILSRELTAVLREYAETLADEVATASSYTAHRYPVTLAGVLLSGAAMDIPGLVEAMRARLPVPADAIRIVRPTLLMDREPESMNASVVCEMRSSDAGLTSACGLAMYPKEAAA